MTKSNTSTRSGGRSTEAVGGVKRWSKHQFGSYIKCRDHSVHGGPPLSLSLAPAEAERRSDTREHIHLHCRVCSPLSRHHVICHVFSRCALVAITLHTTNPRERLSIGWNPPVRLASTSRPGLNRQPILPAVDVAALERRHAIMHPHYHGLGACVERHAAHHSLCGLIFSSSLASLPLTIVGFFPPAVSEWTSNPFPQILPIPN